MKLLLRTATIAVTFVAAGAGRADAAPRELYNKTVVLSWTVAQSLKAPDGRIVNPSTTETRTIYISSAGRLFVRSGRTTEGQSRSADRAPGNRGTDDRAKQVSGWRFQGNTLALMSAFSGSGGSRIAATFDPGFTSCSLSLTFGRAGGAPIRFKGIDGVTYEVVSMSASSASCAIREGNPFGAS